MATSKLTVAICQAQGRNPVKRKLEEDIFSALINLPEVEACLLPHLYDMPQNHSGMDFLRLAPGPILVMGWLYERATRWTLDRAHVRGKHGITLLVADDDEEDDSDFDQPELRGIGSTEIPERNIYCLDLRVRDDAVEFIEEVQRIASIENEEFDLLKFIHGAPTAEQLQKYLRPEEQLKARQAVDSGTGGATEKSLLPEDTRRRWYPVIDYSRCTNCMECIDFCLFGVYGVDALDRILVEEQDNCKKGCPACSRVCPENAIIFPQHKTPAIAGADGEVSGIKIDLSKLFGGDDGESAIEMAVKERDRELVLDGRDAVGMAVGIKERARDEYDELMDELDSLDF